MPVTNSQSNTRIDEIAAGIYRISTPIPPGPGAPPGGFTFNQFLIVDDSPLLFHTGPRRMFPLVREAMATVMPVEKLRWISFGHFEADECGSLNDWLAAAPESMPLCGQMAAMLSIGDYANRAPRALGDGETLSLGKRQVRWHDTSHVPHNWEAGVLSETTTRTLFCGDLFTQAGATHEPITESDILGPSEGMRKAMPYYSNTHTAVDAVNRLAKTEPTTLACMHGASYRGDGAALLRALSGALGGG